MSKKKLYIECDDKVFPVNTFREQEIAGEALRSSGVRFAMIWEGIPRRASSRRTDDFILANREPDEPEPTFIIVDGKAVDL